MKVTLQNGMVIEGDNIDQLTELSSKLETATKTGITIVSDKEKAIVKKVPRPYHGARQWSEDEIFLILENINSSTKKLERLLPGRKSSSVYQMSWALRSGKVNQRTEAIIKKFNLQKAVSRFNETNSVGLQAGGIITNKTL